MPEQPLPHISTPVVAQTVRWGPSDARAAGIRVWNDQGDEQDFIPWSELKDQLERFLMPQLFAAPTGYAFVTSDHNGKSDWLVQIVDSTGQWYCDVWFGNDPDAGWGFDGLVRVGEPHEAPHVWQVYQRYSDGTYRRLASLSPTIDAYRRNRGKQ